MGGPGARFAPAHAGGGSNPEKVDGIRLQALQQMLRLVSGQLQLRGGSLRAGTVPQAIR